MELLICYGRVAVGLAEGGDSQDGVLFADSTDPGLDSSIINHPVMPSGSKMDKRRGAVCT